MVKFFRRPCFLKNTSITGFRFASANNCIASPYFSKLNQMLKHYVPIELMPEIHALIVKCAHDIKTNSSAHEKFTQPQETSSYNPYDFLRNYIKDNEFFIALELLQQLIKERNGMLSNNMSIEELYLRMWTKCTPELSTQDDSKTRDAKQTLLTTLDSLRLKNNAVNHRPNY